MQTDKETRQMVTECLARPTPAWAKPYKPVLKETTDLRQCRNDVDRHYEKEDADLATCGCGRRRLEPRNADIALDCQANRQPDGRRVEHRRQEVDRGEVEGAPAVRYADWIRDQAVTL